MGLILLLVALGLRWYTKDKQLGSVLTFIVYLVIAICWAIVAVKLFNT